MFLLGRQLPDSQKVSIALTAFYGLSHTLASRLCARLQLHEAAKIGELTDGQVTQMSAYLSSPGSIPAQQGKIIRSPLIGQAGKETSTSSSAASSSSSSSSSALPPSQRASPSSDPLRSLLLESDLRRAMQANIAHHRNVGSYKGKRHQQGLPVRGQRTSSNGLTARKLNRIERRGYASLAGRSSTSASSTLATQRPTVSSLLSALKRPASF